MQRSSLASLTAAAALFSLTSISASAALVSGWGLETGAQAATLTEGGAGSFSTTTPTGNAAPRALFTPVSFLVGTTVTLTGSVTLQNVPGNIQFRFGLYDTNGIATGTLSGGNWSGATNTGWSGYFAQPRNLAGGGASILQGKNNTGAWFSGTGSYTLTADSFVDGLGNGSAGGTYAFNLTATRNSASSVSVSWSLTQTAGAGTVSISGSYTDDDSAPNGSSRFSDSFNAAGFLLNANTGSGSFSNIDVTAVPEPSAFAALAGLAGIGFAASRRRRA